MSKHIIPRIYGWLEKNVGMIVDTNIGVKSHKWETDSSNMTWCDI
jgi:hypothetical protein